MSKESLTLQEFWDAKEALIKLARKHHPLLDRCAGAHINSDEQIQPYLVPILTLPCPECTQPSPPPGDPRRYNAAYTEVNTWECPTHGTFKVFAEVDTGVYFALKFTPGSCFTFTAYRIMWWCFREPLRPPGTTPLQHWWNQNMHKAHEFDNQHTFRVEFQTDKGRHLNAYRAGFTRTV